MSPDGIFRAAWTAAILPPGVEMGPTPINFGRHFDMRKFIVTVAAALSMVAAGTAGAADMGKFSVWSPDIKNHKIADEQVFKGFGCSGGNVSPEIDWSGVPAKAKSLTLQIY